MKETTYNIFSLSVKRIEDFLTQEECKIILQNIYEHTERLQPIHWVLDGDAHVSINVIEDIIPFIDKETGISLKERMQTVIDKYSQENNIIENVIEKSWALIQNKNSILKFHNHLKRSPKLAGADSVMSGSLFLETPEGSAHLEFKHPINNHAIITKDNPILKFPPKSGTFMIWPSYVDHGNAAWNTEVRRTVLSFSSYPKQEVQNV